MEYANAHVEMMAVSLELLTYFSVLTGCSTVSDCY